MKNDYEIRGDITAIFIKRKDGTIIETIIDTNDLKLMEHFKNTWRAGSNCNTDDLYAVSSIQRNLKIKAVLLHRFLLDDPEGLVIDHINHNTLDNRRCNLRAITNGQNQQNRKGPQINNNTGVRGLYWNKSAKSYHARVKINGKYKSIGYFKNIKDAEKALIEARKKYLPYSNEKYEGA
jgi:hypothetical protein